VQVVRPDGATVQMGAENVEEGEEWQAILALAASSRRSQSGRAACISASQQGQAPHQHTVVADRVKLASKHAVVADRVGVANAQRNLPMINPPTYRCR
jgi:hypothetical protein